MTSKNMSIVLTTRNYVWKQPGKIYFVTMKIDDQKRYKISIDIRKKPISSKSDDIKDYKDRTVKITGGWITYLDDLPDGIQPISSGELMRNMSEIAFDYGEFTFLFPEFTRSMLFKRKYFEVPYPRNGQVDYDEEYEMGVYSEYLLSGNNLMEIKISKFRSYYRNFKLEKAVDIFDVSKLPSTDEDNQRFCWIDVVKDKFDEDYPVPELFEWALEQAFSFYQPIISTEIDGLRIFPNCISILIMLYVIS